MSKKFVRGITDIKTITDQDFDTNNVNDLLSDKDHNYIHRIKKDGSQEYHNLTNNIKNITSDNTDLLSVTNYNNSTNTAVLHPHHDPQKQDKLTPGYGVSIENGVINAPLFTKLPDQYDLNDLEFGFVRGWSLKNAPSSDWYYIMAVKEGNSAMQIAWKLRTKADNNPSAYRRDKIEGVWTEWVSQ